MTEFREALIVLGAMFRMTAFLVGVFALRHAILKGMYIEHVPLKIRIILYLCGVGLCLSACAALFRIAGMPWAPELREITHIGVSTSIITVSILVMLCPVNRRSIYSLRRSGLAPSIRTNGGEAGHPSIASV